MPVSGSDLGQELRAALVDDGLYLVFQPEFDLRTSEVLAVEALVRWTHPTRGELGPDDFIGLAEKSDLILELGSWVVESALTEFAVWTAQLPDLDVVLRLNVTVAQLQQSSFVADLDAALDRHAVSPTRVCVEITESAPHQDSGQVSHTVRGLKALGVEVAADDFASGYSALSMLRSHPIDIVKIDRSLISGIDSDARAGIIVESVMTLAGRLGLDVVAEGIETEAERTEVLRLGCARGQGYLLSLPLSGPEVIRLLDGRGRRTA